MRLSALSAPEMIIQANLERLERLACVDMEGPVADGSVAHEGHALVAEVVVVGFDEDRPARSKREKRTHSCTHEHTNDAGRDEAPDS